MNIGIRKAGRATILDLEGPLKLGDAEGAFRNQVQQLIDGGSLHVAVNLAGVTELDSLGDWSAGAGVHDVEEGGWEGDLFCGE